MKKMVGIIGCGSMGTAIIRGRKLKFIVAEKDKVVQSYVCREYKAIKSRDINQLVKKCQTIIIAVKPQDIDQVLEEISRAKPAKSILFISIAAGIETKYIEKAIGPKTRVIRGMPNLPAAIGEGVTALVRGRFAEARDMKVAERIFSAVGEVIHIEKEELINVVTALSGSGPAYLFFIFIALKDAAQALGLSRQEANKFIYQTVVGSMNLMKARQFDVEKLIGQVASKGGTTEAALEVFKKKKLKDIILEALIAAHARATELSRKED